MGAGFTADEVAGVEQMAKKTDEADELRKSISQANSWDKIEKATNDYKQKLTEVEDQGKRVKRDAIVNSGIYLAALSGYAISRLW